MIQTLLIQEKPRERCLSQGPESLSLRECLAILLGTGPRGVGCMGVAAKLLEDTQGHSLEESHFFRIFESDIYPRIHAEPGIGPAGQARLLVTFEIAKRYWRFKQKEESATSNSSTNLRKKLRNKIPENFRCSPIESFGIIAEFMDGSFSNFIPLSLGDESSVSISCRKLLQTLLYIKAESFWLFHNHPNNCLEPSNQDVELTRNLRALSKIVGIPLNEHWIVGWNEEQPCD